MTKGTVIYISDMDLKGSGYSTVSIPICKGLQAEGYKVIVLGVGYEKTPHDFDFAIVPVGQMGMIQQCLGMVQNIRLLEEDPIVAIVVALDMPLQIEFLESIVREDIPYIAIYPVESKPIAQQWATKLSQADATLVLSRFGTLAAHEKEIKATYFPVEIDTEAWRKPTTKERTTLRESLGVLEDEKLILTVADNHERKNLWAAFAIIHELRTKHKIKLKWALVTRLTFKAGYILGDLAKDYDLTDIWMPFERGIPFIRLWGLTAAADLQLIPSKAEGLGLPILESMAVGTPVAAVDNTAISELLTEGQGIALPSEFRFLDPWSNSWRDFVDIQKAAAKLAPLFEAPSIMKEIGRKSRAYVKENHNGEESLVVLIKAIEDAARAKEINANVKRSKASQNVAIL